MRHVVLGGAVLNLHGPTRFGINVDGRVEGVLVIEVTCWLRAAP